MNGELDTVGAPGEDHKERGTGMKDRIGDKFADDKLNVLDKVTQGLRT